MNATHSRRRRVDARWVGRATVILVIAAGVAWIATATTIATVVRRSNPVAAMRWWSDAETLAVSATALIQEDQSRSTLERARSLAERALAREPVNVAAARTLGIIADIERNPGQARRYFLYAERLSRRDLPTELSLIEDSVRRNDIEGALLHYDRALRGSRSTREALVPILVRASSDPSVIEPLARLVAGRPPWWPAFADRLVREGRSMSGLFRIARGLRLDPGLEEERQLLARALDRLVESGESARASMLYDQAVRRRGAGSSLRDGGFEAVEPYLPPFDWELTDEPDLAAIRRPSEGRAGIELAVQADNGRGGDVARQILMLPPGTYRLTFLAGGEGEASSRPLLSVKCAAGARQLARIELPTASTTGRPGEARFTVPALGCRSQWLTITARSAIDGGDSGAWIDDLAIRPN